MSAASPWFPVEPTARPACCLVEDVADHAVGELRLEPRRFRRHDLAGVGDLHQIGNGCGVEGESSGGITRGDTAGELAEAAAAANEVDAFVDALVGDAEERFDGVTGEEG